MTTDAKFQGASYVSCLVEFVTYCNVLRSLFKQDRMLFGLHLLVVQAYLHGHQRR